MDELDKKLLSAIPPGHKNAVTSRYLANITGLPERMVRKRIERLVVAGHEIGSTPTHQMGFFKITNRVDLEIALGHLVSRQIKIVSRVRALEKHKAKYGGQMSLEY